jgi:glycosyltransferase involved in cell wall biosynthesis
VISVVVPVRNDAGRLQKCLSSLGRSSHLDHEIIVVDDASTDGTARVAEQSGATLIRLDRRSGPGVARNHGAFAAKGEILVFVDADVCVHEDTLALFSAAFSEAPPPDAVFGAYDASPAEPALISQYKNLSHHFVHRQNAGEATTFWAGCGAMRRSVFLDLGGFDPAYNRPSIEDIELGVRLHRSGRRVLLRPQIQATHLKRWTLAGLLKSDIWDRAVPWTELSLRDGHLPNALNLKAVQRVSAILAWAALGMVVVASAFRPLAAALPIVLLLFLWAADTASHPGARVRRLLASLASAGAVIALAGVATTLGPWLLAIAVPVAAMMILNVSYYSFLLSHRGPLFVLVAVPLHLAYFACAGFGFAVGALRHVTGVYFSALR